jgi:hypothetical protein
VIAVAAVAIIIALLGPVTDLIARHDVSALSPAQRAVHLQAARETARTQILTLGAGIFAALALLFTALNFTLARQGQVTNRYTDAITQLGSKKLDVRIGGIYALERIARDSARDHPTIMEVLTAFVREHSREQWPPRNPPTGEQNRTIRPDVQAAVTVIGRRKPRREVTSIDLSGANLIDANLDNAKLADANLTGVNLSGAQLSFADLILATLTGANLTGANLRWASLGSAQLADAHLDGANLDNAYLGNAKLTGANLTGANLDNANFAEADLTDAFWSPDKAVPEGWSRGPDQTRLVQSTPTVGNAAPS